MADLERLKLQARALQLQAQAKKAAADKQFIQDNMLPSPDDDTTPSRKERDYFGNTVSKFTEPTRNLTQQGVDQAMQAGFDDPASRLAGIGKAGLGLLGTGITGAAGVVGEVLGGNPTQELKAARDVLGMTQFVPEMAGVPSSALRAVNNATANSARQQAAQAASNIGVTPTLGSQGRGAAMIEATLEKIPVTSGRTQAAAIRASDQMDAALDRTVNKIATPTTNTGAGEALQRGADAFVENFREKSTRLYGIMDNKIGKDAYVIAPNTVGVLEDMLRYSEKYPGIAEFIGNPRYQKLLDGLRQGGAYTAMPFDALKDLRSAIGSSRGKINGPLSDLDTGKLDRLYGSLSSDLEAAAKASGPEALAAFERANKFYRAGIERIDNALVKVTKADTPEKAYSTVVALTTADSPRGSAAILNQIKKSLPADDWKTASSTIIRKLGEKTPANRGAEVDDFAEFSASRFLTNWNKMSQGAKTVLSSGAIPNSVRRELDDLAKVAARFKEAGKERNFSNTGTIIAAGSTGAALYAEPVMGALALGGAYISAAAMTSKPFLTAVNAAVKSDFTKLNKLARAGGPFATEANSLLRLAGAEIAKEEERR